MRDLTEREMKFLHDGHRCPFCGQKEFFRGPSGGMSTNWFCANPDCQAGFNLNTVPITGQLIRESKIPQSMADFGQGVDSLARGSIAAYSESDVGYGRDVPPPEDPSQAAQIDRLSTIAVRIVLLGLVLFAVALIMVTR